MIVNQISLEKIKEIYGTRHIGRAQARVLVGLMDFFCFSEVNQVLYNLSPLCRMFEIFFTAYLML